MVSRPLIPHEWSQEHTNAVVGDLSQPQPGEMKVIAPDWTEPPVKYDYSYRQRSYGEPTSPCGLCDTDACTCSSYLDGQYKKGLLRVWQIEPRRLDIVAREFYGYLALQMTTNTDPMPEFVSSTAHNLYRAITLACAGEARYDVSLAVSGIWGARVKKRGSAVLPLPLYNKPFFKYYAKFGVEIPGRSDIAENLLEFVDMYDVEFVRFLRNMFLWAGRYSRGIGSGYGGLMWAACAQIILDWREGRLSDVEFIDRAFNSRHNGAPVLTKVFAYSGGQFEHWLTARSEASLEWLIRWTPNWIRAKFGYDTVAPLNVWYRNAYFSTDNGKSLGVIPDDISQCPDGTPTFNIDSIAKGRETFIAPLLSKLRDDHAFFTYGRKCSCKHGCGGSVSIEHDCNKVCDESCRCVTRLKEVKFGTRKAEGYDTHDPDGDGSDDDGDGYIECYECGSTSHDASDCPFCEWCEQQGHRSSECYSEHYCTICLETDKSYVYVHNCNSCVSQHMQAKGHSSHDHVD